MATLKPGRAHSSDSATTELADASPQTRTLVPGTVDPPASRPSPRGIIFAAAELITILLETAPASSRNLLTASGHLPPSPAKWEALPHPSSPLRALTAPRRGLQTASSA